MCTDEFKALSCFSFFNVAEPYCNLNVAVDSKTFSLQ